MARDFQQLMDEMSRTLPEGWEFTLIICGGGYSLELYDADGEQVSFPTDYETIEQQVVDAIEFMQLPTTKA